MPNRLRKNLKLHFVAPEVRVPLLQMHPILIANVIIEHL